MVRIEGFDYKKAEADLDDLGVHHPEDIYSYRSERDLCSYLKEHGLNPNRYFMPKAEKDSSTSKNDSNLGCYLTTACVTARGLPDNCAELQLLRAFRDGVLARQPGGQKEIEEYYQIAPRIVAAIDQREDAVQIWNRVYDELVAPCVRMIHEGKNEEAYRLYKTYTLSLSNEMCL